MIIRIVRMTFQEDKIAEFLSIFNQYKKAIRTQQGCTYLDLLQDAQFPNVLTTYSHWDNESYLNQYRHSDTFGKVWPATKALFAEPAVAQSYILKEHIEA